MLTETTYPLVEATSALDNESEATIQRAIERIAAAPNGPTVIIVAHRLTTIRNADVIHMMERGKLVETGTHQELAEKRGKYWDLVEAQI
jgi:ABC-type multidrug transport system fused ATPase/permease subunit